MISNSGEARMGWNGALARGGAILLLLGSAACQQAPTDTKGGMFGGGAQKSQNGSAAAPATPVGSGPATAAVGVPAAPVAAPSAATAPVSGTTALAAPGDGQDRRVRINNRSGQTVNLIRGSSSNDSNWGRDRIPTSTLADGSSIIVDFNDNNGQCQYDLQATLQDGTERVQRGADICRITDWTITPDGTEVR